MTTPCLEYLDQRPINEVVVLSFSVFFEEPGFNQCRADDAVFIFSSDITTSHGWRDDAANPYHGMQIGHNRQLVDGYTINGAFQLGRSDEMGSIEVGKQADLVILNQNLFKVSRYDVHKTRPVAVIMDGELVYGEW